MKICILASSKNTHMQHWATCLARKGHEVTFLSFGKSDLEGVISCSIEARMKDSYLKFVVNGRNVRGILRNLNPDILHTIFLTNYGLLAALTKFRPLVVTVAGSDLFLIPRRKRLFYFTNRFVLKRATLIHSVANHMTKKLTKMGIDEEKILTMPEGVDLETFSCKKKREGHFPAILSNRKFKPVYNLELLVRALPHMIKEFSDLRLILIGQGPEETRLRNLVNELQIQENVIFEGAVSRDEIPRYLASADVYISTSLSDGTSASLLEAMACGVFPVVTDIEANREWISHRHQGALVPTDNPKVLAETVIEVLGNKALREKAAITNREMVRRRAEEEDIIDRLIDSYQLIFSLHGP